MAELPWASLWHARLNNALALSEWAMDKIHARAHVSKTAGAWVIKSAGDGYR